MAAKKTTHKKTQPKKKPVAKKAPVETPEPAAAITALTVHQPQELATRDEAIRALMHSINTEERRYIAPADEVPNVYMLRRPSGLMELDIDLGGGWPAGGLSIVSGPDNSGKTWLVLKTMAYQQKIYGHACRLAYALTEGAFPFDVAARAGLQLSLPDEMLDQAQEWRRLRGLPFFTDQELISSFKTEVGKVYIIRGETGERVLKTMIDCVHTKAFSLIACDSLNGLQPSIDADKELTDNEKMAAHAAMVGKFLKKYVPLTTGLNGSNTTTVLFTQQVRANMERSNMNPAIQKYIKPWATAGAWASRHYKLIDLHVWSGSVIKKGAPKVAVAKEFKWLIDKGKAGTHDNKNGEATFYYSLGGTDDIGELITSGIKRGVIALRGKQTVVRRPDTGEVLEDFTAPNQKVMRKMLENDFDYELALRREILTQAGIQCLYQ